MAKRLDENGLLYFWQGLKTKLATKYEKPSGGIPKTDLASAVQTSLDKADSAIQSHQDISGKADKSDTYTKAQVDAKVSGAMSYKGSVNNYSDLPASGQSTGDVYNIVNADTQHGIKAGDNVAWNGSTWDVLGGAIDLSAYWAKSELVALTNAEIEAIFDQ